MAKLDIKEYVLSGDIDEEVIPRMVQLAATLFPEKTRESSL